MNKTKETDAKWIRKRENKPNPNPQMGMGNQRPIGRNSTGNSSRECRGGGGIYIEGPDGEKQCKDRTVRIRSEGAERAEQGSANGDRLAWDRDRRRGFVSPSSAPRLQPVDGRHVSVARLFSSPERTLFFFFFSRGGRVFSPHGVNPWRSAVPFGARWMLGAVGPRQLLRVGCTMGRHFGLLGLFPSRRSTRDIRQTTATVDTCNIAYINHCLTSFYFFFLYHLTFRKKQIKPTRYG